MQNLIRSLTMMLQRTSPNKFSATAECAPTPAAPAPCRPLCLPFARARLRRIAVTIGVLVTLASAGPLSLAAAEGPAAETAVTPTATAQPADFAGEWVVGGLLCMSGACAESGVNSVRAVELAVDEVNARGGVLGKRARFVVEDTDEGQSSGRGAVTAFRKLLLNPSIRFLIGPSWTPGGLAVAPLAAKAEVLLIAPSIGVAQFNETAPNIFCTWPHDEVGSAFVAAEMRRRGISKVAVFSSQQPWEDLQGKTVAAEFTRLGGSVVRHETPLPTQTDLRMESLRLLRSEPEAVVLTNYTQMATAARQLRTLGYTGPFFAILLSEERLAQSKGALEGAMYLGYPPSKKEFVDRYQAKFGEVPGINADTTYDAFMLYVWAIEAEQSFDRMRVQQRLLTASFEGASGLIQFDAAGGVKKTPTLYKVVQGRLREPAE